MIKKVGFFLCFFFAVSNANAIDIEYKTGKTIKLDLSYTNPNYVSVEGDIITKITSLDNNLLSEGTTSGGMILVVNNPTEEFTFIIQTQNGLVIPAYSNAADMKGNYINIITDKINKTKEPQKWEKGNDYETSLINIALEMINNGGEAKPQKADNKKVKTLKVNGIEAKPEFLFVGNGIYVTSYQATNKTKSTIKVNESEFADNGVKAVFFERDIGLLQPNQSVRLFLIRAVE